MSLKDILPEQLWGQVESAINAHNSAQTDKSKQCKLVDLADGGYVSKDKYDDRATSLQAQIDSLNATIAKRDADLKTLTDQLTSAGADKAKLGDVQSQFAALQAKYDQDKQAWQADLAKQAYLSLVKEKAGELSFSSVSAKKAFIADAVEKNFRMDGSTLQGYSDWLKDYQAADPGAFAVADVKKPTIVIPGNTGQNKTPKPTLWEQMQRKNADPNYQPNFD